MKTLIAMTALILGTTGAAHAECPTKTAVQLVAQSIKEFQSEIKEDYSDVKYTASWGSFDNQAPTTTVLFTYTSFHPNEIPASGTRIGYAFFDAICNSLGSVNDGDAGSISK